MNQAVVEAQRRFTRSGFHSIDDADTEEDFRTLLALRGLGNLKEIKINKGSLRMRLENAAMPLIIVGIMQGTFDGFLGLDQTLNGSSRKRETWR